MQSGIPVDPSLVDEFKEFVLDNSAYGLIAKISDERIVSGGVARSASEVTEKITETEPRYVILKDPVGVSRKVVSPAAFPRSPLFAVAFVPPSARIREKTIYASSFRSFQANLTGIENSAFAETPFLTRATEFEPAGWKAYAAAKDAPPPLTEKEKILKDLDSATLGGLTARMPLAGMAPMGMPGLSRSGSDSESKKGKGNNIDERATEALRKFAEGRPGDVVQMKIDTSETVQLVETSSDQTPSSLSVSLCETEPRYIFFRYFHQESTEPENSSVVFLSYIPMKSQVRIRMLHSCAKVGLGRHAEFDVNLAIGKRIEASDRSEAAGLLSDFFREPVSKVRPQPGPKPGSFVGSNSASSTAASDGDAVEDSDVVTPDASSARAIPGVGPSPLADVLMGRRPKGPGRR